MCNITPAYFSGKVPLLLLTNESTYWQPADSVIITSRINKEIAKIFAKDGVKYMGWSTEQPPVVTIGTKPFKTFDDYKGMKIRAPGKSAKVINSWGGTGVSIPAPDLYMALQNKVVDGAFLSIGTVEGARLWEVAPAITTTIAGGTPQLACMNMKKWESLPEDVKKAFEKVNREMVPWAYHHAFEYTKTLDDMMKKNFKIYHLRTPEEHAVFVKYAKDVYSGPLLKKFGEPAQVMWNKILAAAKECEDGRKEGKTPPFFKD
jgi:TRAP-type C4-dicarboxylate transport system substrate-binding protein